MTAASGRTHPAATGMPDSFADDLETIVRDGLDRTGVPGAVVLVARHGRLVHPTVQGWAATHDAEGPLASRRPMRPDTLFDVASLTHVAATTIDFHPVLPSEPRATAR